MSQCNHAVKVLIIHERACAPEAMCTLLVREGYAHAVAESPAQALALYAAEPDIGLIICAVQTPGTEHWALVRSLERAGGAQRAFRAMLVSQDGGASAVLRAMRAGFADYHARPLDLDEWLTQVQRLEGEVLQRRRAQQEVEHLSQRLQDLGDFIDHLHQDLERARGGNLARRSTDLDVEVETDLELLPAVFGALSPRQLEVARLVGRGQTNHQIACALGITENTVKLYVSQVLRLTRMHNRTQLALALTPSSSPVRQRLTNH
ncbi:LuxR C-terminal-related transcriptional regulator [Pseudomonas monteilii]